MEQAGAELGQAQIKLGLGPIPISICCIVLINKLGLSCAKLRTASLLRLLLLVNSNFGNVKKEVLHVR